MNRSIGPLVLWCAAGIYFVCSYPMSPPGTVPGLSSYKFALGLFVATTILLMLSVFKLGEACLACGRREGAIKRLAYAWLSLTVLAVSLGVYDLVSRGAASINLPLMVLYGLGGFFMVGFFFVLRYWKERTGREENLSKPMG